VTGILRLGSLLTILLLVAPTVRDCCLPVAQSQPCHESKHHTDVTCSAVRQAIADNKEAVTRTGRHVYDDAELPHASAHYADLTPTFIPNVFKRGQRVSSADGRHHS
jgi:hypothetical protein